MESKLLMVTLLLMSTLSTSTECKDEGLITVYINNEIDQLMPQLVNYIANNMDSMPLPDHYESFSEKLLLITYTGKLRLTNGKLKGLTTLARTGDVVITYLDKKLKIKGNFGFKTIGFTYDYWRSLMNYDSTGRVDGTVSDIEGDCVIGIDLIENKINLQELYLHDVGKIKIKLSGHAIVDRLSSLMINTITALFKNVIVDSIESNLQTALQEIIGNINIIINGIPKISIQAIIPELAVRYPQFLSNMNLSMFN